MTPPAIGEILSPEGGLLGSIPMFKRRGASSIHPASYFTGPLGANNPVPDGPGAFLGVWGPGQDGGATTFAQIQANIDTRETQMGRRYDFILTTDTNQAAEWPDNRLPWINSEGYIACCHLGSGLTHAGVIAGNHDALLDSLIARWGSYSFVVMIRLFHEFDQPTSYFAFNNPSQFVQSWQYIVDRFHSNGADNCGFWWCPTEGANRDLALQCWPGNDYVDWAGTDGYNWPLHGETDPPQATYVAKYASPYEAGWIPFETVFHYPLGFANLVNYHDRYGPMKPFVLGEVGCTYDAFQLGSDKGDWYRAIPDVLRNAMPHCKGICFFDIDASAESASDYKYTDRNDWRIPRLESNATILAGFVEMAQDSWLRTRE